MMADHRLAVLSQQLARGAERAPPVPPPLAAAPTLGRADYDTMYGESINDPEAFWSRAAAEIDWDVPYTSLVTHTTPHYSWFGGGELSMCHNAVDRHLKHRADQAAIIYDSPVLGIVEHISYRELHRQVSKAAGMLLKLGVGIGDRVIVYMPMIPEAIVAMLACSRIGAVHSVVFGGFAAPELAVRIDDAEPVAILTASCGIEGSKVIDYMPLLNRAIEIAECKPRAVVIKQREQSPVTLTAGRDHDWDDAVSAAEPTDCVSVPSNHPLYILYTSGSTGKPKVRKTVLLSAFYIQLIILPRQTWGKHRESCTKQRKRFLAGHPP